MIPQLSLFPSQVVEDGVEEKGVVGKVVDKVKLLLARLAGRIGAVLRLGRRAQSQESQGRGFKAGVSNEVK